MEGVVLLHYPTIRIPLGLEIHIIHHLIPIRICHTHDVVDSGGARCKSCRSWRKACASRTPIRRQNKSLLLGVCRGRWKAVHVKFGGEGAIIWIEKRRSS